MEGGGSHSLLASTSCPNDKPKMQIRSFLSWLRNLQWRLLASRRKRRLPSLKVKAIHNLPQAGSHILLGPLKSLCSTPSPYPNPLPQAPVAPDSLKAFTVGGFHYLKCLPSCSHPRVHLLGDPAQVSLPLAPTDPAQMLPLNLSVPSPPPSEFLLVAELSLVAVSDSSTRGQ